MRVSNSKDRNIFITIRGNMKLYDRKLKRYVNKQVHFGVGNSTKTACGLHLFSRRVMVSIYCTGSNELISSNIEKVTCKRCLATKESKLRKLLKIEQECPGIFDRESLCGEQWLIDNALNFKREDSNKLSLKIENTTLDNTFKAKDRIFILKNLLNKRSVNNSSL